MGAIGVFFTKYVGMSTSFDMSSTYFTLSQRDRCGKDFQSTHEKRLKMSKGNSIHIKKSQIEELFYELSFELLNTSLPELKKWSKNSAKLFKGLFSRRGSGIILIFIILSFLMGQTKQISFPLSDSNNYYTKGAHSVSIDSSGNVSVEKLEIVVTDEIDVSNQIKINNYIKIKKAIDKVSRIGVPIIIKGKFAYLNNEMYFDSKTKINIKYYNEHVLSKNSDGVIELEREQIKYTLNIKPSGELNRKIGDSKNFGRFLQSVGFPDWEKNDFQLEIQTLNKKEITDINKVSPENNIIYLKNYKKTINELGWLNKDLTGVIIKDGELITKVTLKWNPKGGNHHFNYWSRDSFDLYIDDKRFYSLVIKWNLWKKGSGNEKNIKYERISLKPYMFYGSQPFFTDKNIRGSIDSNGVIVIDKFERVIKTYLKSNKGIDNDSLKIIKDRYVKSNSLKEAPYIIDNVSNELVATNFEGKVSYDGQNMLFSDNTIFSKNKYVSASLKNSKSGILRLKRSEVDYLVHLQGSDYVNKSKILSNDYAAIIVSDYSKTKKRSRIRWNGKENYHFFRFWSIEPFVIYIDDDKIESGKYNFNKNDMSNKNSRRGKNIDIALKAFNINVKYVGERSKRVRKITLSSTVNPGIKQINNPMVDGESYYTKFLGLDWNNSPFTIKSVGNNTHVEDYNVQLETHFNKTIVNNNRIPVLDIEIPVWSVMKFISLSVVDSLNKPINGLKIKLIDSPNLPDRLKLNTPELKLSKEYIIYESIYDWNNISFKVIDNKIQSHEIKITDSIVEQSIGGRGRLNCVVKYSDILFNE